MITSQFKRRVWHHSGPRISELMLCDSCCCETRMLCVTWQYQEDTSVSQKTKRSALCGRRSNLCTNTGNDGSKATSFDCTVVNTLKICMNKPPLVKVQIALKNKKNRRKTIFNMADKIITPCNVARSWHWFRQVTAPCNVACGSEITTVNLPSGSTLQCDTWLWGDRDMPLNSLIGNTLQCDT